MPVVESPRALLKRAATWSSRLGRGAAGDSAAASVVWGSGGPRAACRSAWTASGTSTLTVGTASLAEDSTLIEADAIGALAVTLAFCGGDTLIDVLLDGLGATVEEVAEILLALGLGDLIP